MCAPLPRPPPQPPPRRPSFAQLSYPPLAPRTPLITSTRLDIASGWAGGETRSAQYCVSTPRRHPSACE
eukprot:7897870-Pyramimonas_sp.AAC.1